LRPGGSGPRHRIEKIASKSANVGKLYFEVAQWVWAKRRALTTRIVKPFPTSEKWPPKRLRDWRPPKRGRRVYVEAKPARPSGLGGRSRRAMRCVRQWEPGIVVQVGAGQARRLRDGKDRGPDCPRPTPGFPGARSPSPGARGVRRGGPSAGEPEAQGPRGVPARDSGAGLSQLAGVRMGRRTGFRRGFTRGRGGGISQVI
jgi:hypothetical protein